MKHVTFALILLIAFPLFAIGQDFTILESDNHHISFRFELSDFSIDTVHRNGELMHTITTKSIVGPNEYGQPDLPTFNRFIALPQGATAVVEVRTTRSQHIANVNIVPSIGSQSENDAERPFFKDQRTYAVDALYPATMVQTAEPQSLRGVDVIHLGICPIQFNPVRHEIAVNSQIEIEIRFEGGNGHFGDDRLRSPYWDPILQNSLLNYSCLEPIDYDARMQSWTQNRSTGCEYLILTPNNEAFREAAQELADYRLKQGILTKVMTIAETGITAPYPRNLRQWFKDIYQNWDIPPAAVCILGDHGNDVQQYVPAFRTTHPIEDSVYTDNFYADVNNDHLPDICFSRLVAQNESELPIFISKQIEYEYTNPNLTSSFYERPLTASAWQTVKWFQLTISTIYGYLCQHGKNPTRLSEIYNGELSEHWSSATNTSSVVSYFGPDGLGYIPASPEELGGWTGATAQDVMRAINEGTYLIQHRDHGWTTKWYQPEIYTTDFGSINNPGKVTYLLSINCRTGHFDYHSDCFTEALMRMTRNGQNAGIVGAISPMGQTYSFGNDLYIWGVWDLFDPSFLPDYGPYASHIDEWLPSFANVSGKYFLDEHVFPNTNEEMRTTVMNAFHTHGDAFLRIFTELPQPIQADHDETLTCFSPFHVTAPAGTQIALTTLRNGHPHILATAIGTGHTQALTVLEPIFSRNIRLTITGKNFLRHEEDIIVSPIERPFVIVDSIAVNGSGQTLHYDQSATIDISITNAGTEVCNTGTVVMTSSSNHINITQGEASFTALQPRENRQIEDAFHFVISDAIPDGTRVPVTFSTHFGNETYEQRYSILALAPHITARLLAIDDSMGNQNGQLDPDEYASLTFQITNNGHYQAESPHVSLVDNEGGFVNVLTPEILLNDLGIGESADITFEIYVTPEAEVSTHVSTLLSAVVKGLTATQAFDFCMGFIEEGFERGEFNSEFWTNDPTHPWTISQEDPYEGSYCAKSGTITHDQNSRLSLTYKSVDSHDFTFSFFLRVSSETNYDFLIFSVDGEILEQWSGEQPWEEHSYQISPGVHTYSWLYSKDYSVSNDGDCAWLDYITLPPDFESIPGQADQPLVIHPNPTTDQIQIETEQEGDFTVQVYDGNGRLILSKQNASVLSFKGIPAGMYHIVLTQNRMRWSSKIIKL